MAHTNQDDKEKRMNDLIPIDDKELGLALVSSFQDFSSTITKLAFFVDSIPGNLPQDIGTFEGALLSDSIESIPVNPIRGFITPIQPSSEEKNIGDFDGFTSPAVPAPGVLGLLVLAGLTANRRRRS